MNLLTATILLIAAIAGVVVSSSCLRRKKALCIVCMVLCLLIALALIWYIGLTVLFIDAARNKPPTVSVVRMTAIPALLQ